MATITPTLGTGMYVEINGSVMRAASFERSPAVTANEYPTSNMSANADGVFETPHAGNLSKTNVTIRGPFDASAPFFAAPFTIRKGVTVAIRLGQSAALVTPAVSYLVESTRDMIDVIRLGEWEATFKPTSDSDTGYYTGTV